MNYNTNRESDTCWKFYLPIIARRQSQRPLNSGQRESFMSDPKLQLAFQLENKFYVSNRVYALSLRTRTFNCSENIGFGTQVEIGKKLSSCYKICQTA